MKDTNSYEWIRQQPEDIQLAFGLSMSVLKIWYGPGNEHPRLTRLALLDKLGFDTNQILKGAKAYMRLIGGSDAWVPEAPRSFLRQSRDLVIPIFRALLDKQLTIPEREWHGRIDIAMFSEVVDRCLLGALLNPEPRAAITAEIGALRARMLTSYIAPDVLVHASKCVESGEIAVGHPAYGFVTALIGDAEITHGIPGRVASLLALVMPPE